MRQILHLLVVHAGSGAALATQHGSRWLLPVVACSDRSRADPIAVRWAAERGVPSDVVGQWLGRVAPDGTDWLMVLSAGPSVFQRERALTWTPLPTLARGSALIGYQEWAVKRALEEGRLPSVAGPFGRFGWIGDVREWIARRAGSPGCVAITQFRSTAHEVVLRARTAHAEMYFKGLTPERSLEASITRRLAALAPRHFARTLALDERPDGSVWWLSAACEGQRAVHQSRAVAALARVQRQVMDAVPSLGELPSLDLQAAVRWAVELTGEREAAALEDAMRIVVESPVPWSWIPMDLDPSNVLDDERGNVSFIDLDDSFAGPAPLAAAVFARRCRDASLYGRYEESWSPALTAMAWTCFDVTAAVLEAWLGWHRLVRNTRRGEIVGAVDLARIRLRERLLRLAYRR